MIIDFSVSNFGPIREEQLLSFEATADGSLSDYLINSNTSVTLFSIAVHR